MSLTNLPLEILEMCFVPSLEKPYRTHEPVSPLFLTHINRRLRCAALEIPDLWRTVSASQGLDEVRAHVTRSAGRGLHVQICLKVGACGFLHEEYATARSEDLSPSPNAQGLKRLAVFLSEVGPLSSRWVSFTLDLNATISSDFPHVNRILRTELQLDRLEDIFIFLENCDSYDRTGQSVLGDIDFYDSWSVPNLSKLFLEQALPRWTPTSLTMSSHTSLREVRVLAVDMPLDHAHLLIGLIAASPQLERLFLHWEALTMPLEADHFPALNLPRLQDLHLHLQEVVPETMVAMFMRALYAPNLTHMELYAYEEEGAPVEMTIDEWKRGVFSEEKIYASVRSLTLKLSLEFTEEEMPEDYPEEGFHMDGYLGRFPSVERLNLSITHFEPPRTLPLVFPPLRSVYFYDCRHLDTDFVLAFLQGICGGPHAAVFETLWIDKCPLVIREEVERVFPEGKQLLWARRSDRPLGW